MAYDYTRSTVSQVLTGSSASSAFEVSPSEQNMIKKAISNPMGIEAMPYQFSATVDRRYGDTNGTIVGRKYAEKILSRFPLLFITPCKAQFMDGFSKGNRTNAISALISGESQDVQETLDQTGRYYSPVFDYTEYFNYLNIMLNSIAVYLNIGDVSVKMGNGNRVKLANADWSNDQNPEFKTFFSSKENLIFYVDNFSQVSQSFSNDTTDSSLAQSVNGIADQMNEIKFLFANDADSIVSTLGVSATSITESLSEGLGSTADSIAGGIVGSLVENAPNSVLNGGKIIFPQVWSNSTTDDGSASFDFKFRSPDHDTLSIYLNVIKPYCKLLALTIPHMTPGDPTSYNSPFLIKAYLKGKFAVDFGMITSLSVTKGAECQWNDDGLPTQIDASLEIKNLYTNLSIPRYSGVLGSKHLLDVVNNTAYMDFLANMSGLNIAQMEIGRKYEFLYYLGKSGAVNTGSRLYSKGSEAISRLFGNLYNRLS